jgi:hypothetical protein
MEKLGFGIQQLKNEREKGFFRERERENEPERGLWFSNGA